MISREPIVCFQSPAMPKNHLNQCIPMTCQPITFRDVTQVLPWISLMLDGQILQNSPTSNMTGGGEKPLNPGGGPYDSVTRLKRELEERLASRKRRAHGHDQPAPARQHPASLAPSLSRPPVQLPDGPGGDVASVVPPPPPPPPRSRARKPSRRMRKIAHRVQ